MFDSHTHGYYSYDSDTDYNDMIRTAILKGLDGICFTDHYEYNIAQNEIRLIDLNKYLSDLHSFSENQFYKGIKILKGIEFGVSETNIDMFNDIMNNYEFDSIIGSVHFVTGYPDIYYHYYTDNTDKITAYSRVLETYIKLIPKYNKINIMGHFDYMARNPVAYKDKNVYYKDFPDHFDKIFTMLVSRGISLEINTTAEYLDVNILKRYKELGGNMITLGSDAHNTFLIAKLFKEKAEFIKSAGFPFLTHFEAGKPVFDKI